MGSYGPVRAHIKTGRSPMAQAQDHFQTPPDPKKGYYTVTKVCWFLMESFLMEIKSAAKFCTRHLLLEPKQCESAWAEYLYLSAVGGVCFCAIKIRWSRFVHPIEYIII